MRYIFGCDISLDAIYLWTRYIASVPSAVQALFIHAVVVPADDVVVDVIHDVDEGAFIPNDIFIIPLLPFRAIRAIRAFGANWAFRTFWTRYIASVRYAVGGSGYGGLQRADNRCQSAIVVKIGACIAVCRRFQTSQFLRWGVTEFGIGRRIGIGIGIGIGGIGCA